ncbi:hypothetical protein DMB38_32985 [Streptomyces sp. WAC 06738]|nr:hypothetical protein DMB38_32985 [Streptomyces sp. WAC 06738]
MPTEKRVAKIGALAATAVAAKTPYERFVLRSIAILATPAVLAIAAFAVFAGVNQWMYQEPAHAPVGSSAHSTV